MCERWKSFESFLEDMGERPCGATLDRIDNDSDYDPRNCRWATPKQQSHNSSRAKFVAFRGKKIKVVDLASRYGVKASLLARRLNQGIPIERAILNVDQRALPEVVELVRRVKAVRRATRVL